MFGANASDDKALLKAVSQRLSRGTGSQVRASATVRSGTVTVTGQLQRESQRIPIIKEISRIAGVRRIVDQFTLRPKNVYTTGPEMAAAPEPETGDVVEAAEAEAPPLSDAKKSMLAMLNSHNRPAEPPSVGQ